jgi:predicted metal-dependent hydrolase
MLDHDAFWRGASLFDRGEFFDAHEAWEERWRVTEDLGERQLLQGLIQVTAAFHKLFVRQSLDSAQRLLARGLAKLEASPELVDGFDLANFRAGLRQCGADLPATQLDRSRLPRMGVVERPGSG